MLKMWSWLFHLHLFILCLMGLNVSGQESNIELLSLCETRDEVLQASLSQPDKPIAVSVSYGDLNGVSSSILLAESWLRSNVLARYPAAKITTIVLNSDSCQRGQDDQNFHLVLLSSLKNVYHSLKRWGLEKDIKVSVAFPLKCLQYDHMKIMANLKPLIEYIQSVNSTYSLIPNLGSSHFTHQNSLNLFYSHLGSMKNLGLFSYPKKFNVLTILPKGRKPITRKLVDSSSLIDPFPLISEPPMVGSPTPSTTLAPQQPPPQFIVPASSPHAFTLPPCSNNPTERGSPEAAQLGQAQQRSWCVAKPSVPAVKLQQALEYACGEGGADCREISTVGKCFNPDNVVAHASYAFNSYWQKQKRNGGTCYFGGTAMLVASDPSFLHCRFILS